VTAADTIVWCTGDISIEIMPMEAKSEKIPTIAIACELRGVAFSNSALGPPAGEL
jgi:hypothetical protein